MNLAIVGCGSIGGAIAMAIDKESGIVLVSLFDIDPKRANDLKNKLSSPHGRSSSPAVVADIKDILKDDSIDLVVEAASQEVVRHYGAKILKSGKNVMIMSVGAFADDSLFEEMKKIAREKNLNIYIPSGAVLGIDGIKAAGVAGITSVMLTTRKPPSGLGVDVAAETILYEGPAREGVKKYPKNVNVAATLALSGVGLDKTRLKIIADPGIDRNIHEIRVSGEFGEFEVRVENLPSPENPRTSYLAVLSAIAMLRGIGGVVRIGT